MDKRRFLGLLGIALLGLLLYSRITNAPFVLDDYPTIVENEEIKNLQECIRDLKDSRYLGKVSFSFNYLISGLNPLGYHLTNNIIHVINALLIYFLIKLIFRTPVMKGSKLSQDFIAFSTSIVFLVHPIQTQAVTYITQRFASMSTLFYISSLIFFIRARLAIMEDNTFFSKQHLWNYSLCVFSSIFAMKTKEIAITLPFILVLFEGCFIKIKEPRFKKILYFLPIVLTIFIIPLSLLDLKRPISTAIRDIVSITMMREETLPRDQYLFTEFRVILTYLRLLVLPVNQNLLYDYPVYKSILIPEVLLSLIALTGLVVFAILIRRKSTLIAFGILWFFITLSVESSIIPIRHVIFEHRLYLPSLGFFIAGTTALESLMSNKILKIFLIIFIVISLSIATYKRNELWRDPIRLWEDTVRKSPMSARAHNGLGAFYMDAGLLEKAIAEFKRALELNPDSVIANYNLGKVYREIGQLNKAIKHFSKALTFKTYYSPQIYNELALVYKDKGDYEEAIKQFKNAIAINPSYRVAYFNLANTYSKIGKFQEAVSYYEKALRLKGDRVLLPEIYNNLGLVLSKIGRSDLAIETFEKGMSLFPSYMPYYANLGNEYIKLNDLDKAIDIFEKGLSIKEEWYLYVNVSRAYASRGDKEKSRLALQKAIRLMRD
jgi:tetratricopeptide (TPR) repeat protein